MADLCTKESLSTHLPSRKTIRQRKRPTAITSLTLNILQGPLLILSLLASGPAIADSLTRAPLLQLVTPTSAVIRWKTKGKSNSQVQIGTHWNQLTVIQKDSNKEKDHEIQIKDLLPSTTYYYTVGSSSETLTKPGPTFSFHTAPSTPEESQEIRVWVLGDPGTGKTDQKEVRDAYLEVTNNKRTDIILTVGDNAYDKGTENEFDKNFFAIYKDIFSNIAVWPSRGNHDNDTKVYRKIFSLPKKGEAGGVPSDSEEFYSFNYGPAHFVCIYSDISDLNSKHKMVKWLKEDLQKNSSAWTIAYFHHAPYSKGSHDSDDDEKMVNMRKIVTPILEEGGVDLVLGGHSHSYERSYLIDGHYGLAKDFKKSMIVKPGNGNPEESSAYLKKGTMPTPHSGTIYQLIGTSGRDNNKGMDLNHPTSVSVSGEGGSVVLTITPQQLQSEFLTIDKRVKDRFVIQKEI